jgi:hypothetical protein
LGDDFGRIAFLSGFLIFPRPGLQPSFDENTPAFSQVFMTVFGLFAKDHDPVPFRLFHSLPIGTGPVVCGGDIKSAYRRLVGCIAQFWVLTKISQNHNAVKRSHKFTSQP